MPSSREKDRQPIRLRNSLQPEVPMADAGQLERYFRSLTPEHRKVALALMKALLRVQQKTG
ncbi:MAG: hypothetical protein RIS44_1862 [Pseudomonadota bacterium]|jgi:hypothetical protein